MSSPLFFSPNKQPVLPIQLTPQKNSSAKRQRKLLVTSGEKNENNLEFQLFIKAFNNSFLRKMSGDEQIFDPHNFLTILVQFALNSKLGNIQKEDISAKKWCVVGVDQRFLQNKGIGNLKSSSSLFACNTSSTEQEFFKRSITTEVPSTVKPYCLVFNMGQKQLHFQSQLEAENNFYINLDTIQVHLDKYNSTFGSTNSKSQTNQPIVLRIIQKQSPLIICMYITHSILPYPFNEIATNLEKTTYLNSCWDSLYILLQKAISQSRGNQLKLKKVLQAAIKNQKKFYNTRFATQQQFVKYCEPGDVLLFRDNHTMAKVQRVITNSQYDHVGVIYKSQQFGICVFQSSSGIGVGLASWRKLIRGRFFSNIDRISWRKLQVQNKPQDFDKKIDQFVRGNIKKQFGLNLPKLLTLKSPIYNKNENDVDKTYFCSQLVADLYKYLGLLDPERSSSKYWPRDFADGNGIQIVNGCLDFEKQIIFQNSLLKQTYSEFK